MPPPPDDDFRTDDELARAHQRGDAAAFPVLVRRHEVRLRAYVCGDPAWAGGGQLLVGHIWTAADRNIREGKLRGPFRGWLFKVAQAVARQHAGGTPTPRAERLATGFGKLRRAKPKWHRLVMWVSHGLNRTAVAKRHHITKAGLKERYTRAVSAVKELPPAGTGDPLRLHLAGVPFDSARLPAWVERHLAGDHLGELIEELLALRPPPAELNFDSWFAPLKDHILSGGLAKVPRKALRQLLADPLALRHLQTAVLVGGGRYWDAVPRSKGFLRRLSGTRPAAPPPVDSRTPAPRRPAPRPLPPEPVLLTKAPPARKPLPAGVVVAAVAVTAVVSVVLVVVILLTTSRGE
jgi:hypothetical protein